MWVILLTIFICTFIFYFSITTIENKDINNNKDIIVFANFFLMACVCIITFLVCNTHSSMITPIIEDYENGKIIKQEKIVIEDTDTIKVIKYKYKF